MKSGTLKRGATAQKLGCEMQPEQEITARDAIRLFTSKRHKTAVFGPMVQNGSAQQRHQDIWKVRN